MTQNDREPTRQSKSTNKFVTVALTAKDRNVWLIAVLVAIVSLGILISFESLNEWVKAAFGFELSSIWKELSLHIFTDSVALILVGLYYERYVRKENASLFLQQLFNTDIILRDLSEEKVAEIGKAALSRAFNDADFGSDLFGMLRTRVRRTNEQMYDYNSQMTLRVPALPHLAREFFEVIIVTSYQKVIRQSVLDFMITDNLETWEEAMIDRKVELCYLLRKGDGIATRMPYDDDVFTVTDLWIEHDKLDLSKESVNGDNFFTARIPLKHQSRSDRVQVRYVFKTLIRRAGHQLSQGPAVPSKGVTMSLNVSQVPIAAFSMVPFFTSANKPVFVSIPFDKPYEKQVTVDGWVLPRSGAVWIWTLEDEVLKTQAVTANSGSALKN